jgi:hypothetical protein
MGTTLTGTTPQDTYDSLIKVTDNGPLTGSLKKLTDGLGNDSSLSLSTSAASVTGTLAVTAGVTLASASGNVGIGASPITKLSVVDGTNTYAASFDGAGGTSLVALGTTAGGPTIAGFTAAFAGSANLIINPDGGNVGIGTTAPAVPLDVTGNIRSSTGILFGSDTAAANLLDDYEEGTFTATLTPSTSGTISLFSGFRTLSYTKIGRQVTIRGLLLVEAVSSPVGTEVLIGGLPFTPAAGNSNRGSAAITLRGLSASVMQPNVNLPSDTNWYVIINASTVTTTTNSDWYITATYFV